MKKVRAKPNLEIKAVYQPRRMASLRSGRILDVGGSTWRMTLYESILARRILELLCKP